LLAIDEAEYRIDSKVHPHNTAKIFSYLSPRFYIPRLAAYPRWFVVQTARSDDHLPTYLVFEKSSVIQETWNVALAPKSSKGATLPEVSTDADGFASAVTFGSSSASITKKIANEHAAILERGPTSSGTVRFKADSYTAQLRKNDANQKIQVLATAKVTNEYRLAPGSPVYALRASTGGALVFYPIECDSTFTTFPMTQVAGDDSVIALTGRFEFVRRIDIVRMDQFAASVAKSGLVSVIGHAGGLTAASLRNS